MKTAVILTARKEHDNQIPYPLMPIGKEGCLLDRALSILQEYGFTKIFIVVGFCADSFRKYESDTTHLILNGNYQYTASMGSLALVQNFIDEDFLLIEGDTFFEKTVVKELVKTHHRNCLSITEESGSGDEAFVELKEGYVTNITKDRHRVHRFEGEMMGVSKLSLSTYQKMMIEWTESENPLLNYEYLFFDCTDVLERPYIYFKNVIWGDVDCQEDYHRLTNDTARRLQRKENPYDEDNLRQHLSAIFPNHDVSTAEFIQIGGMSNKNFRVNFEGKSYVLRLPGNGSEGMVERSHEMFNAIEACKMGVNPPIRYFDAKTGIKLADYVENAETLNAATIQRHDNMKKIVEIYKKIHNSHIRLKNEFNIFKEIEKYDCLIVKSGAKMYEGWENIRPKVMALEQYLNRLGVDLKPCHNDALYENFIKASDGTLYLIDWEYSGMNDPMADFAALFIEAEFTSDNKNFILEKYFEGTIPSSTYEKIICYEILWDYLWAQWTIIKEAKGDDFGTYGFDRYMRAIDNLKYIKL